MGQLSRGLLGLCAKAEIVKGQERLESALTRGRSSVSHMVANFICERVYY